MTDGEWQTSADAHRMLASWRRLCRLMQPLFAHDLFPFTVEVIEGIADGAPESEWQRPLRATWEQDGGWLDSPGRDVGAAVYPAAFPWEFWEAYDALIARVNAVLRTAASADGAGDAVSGAAIPDLLRCAVGYPFLAATYDPAWRTSTVSTLAAGIYADRAFDRLPTLADALEDAGCDNPDVMAHCRGPGPHVRGCWVIDMPLGKE